MEYKGIDVSKWQGNIDYTKVKNQGIKFVIIRIGYGMYENQKDPTFETNYTNATKNNLPVGIYLYSYALSTKDATKEAEITLKWLNNRKLDLPVYLDVEDKSQTNLSKEKLTQICTTFLEKIKSAGYKAGIYANKYWLNTHLNTSELEKKYTIWVAQYNTKNTYNGKYDMWQYTSKGKIDGINTNVDMNILYNNIINTNENQTTLPNLENYQGQSIVDALKSIGYDSTFQSRKQLYKQAGFTDTYTGTSTQNINLLSKLKANTTYTKTTYKGFSLVDGLKSMNIDSSFNNRKKIAQKNGITNYTGSFWQNTKLLNLLKKGQLKA